MRILVFGKNGQVARCLQDEASATDLTALSSDECNLLSPCVGADAIATHRADVIVNAAAYTAVDKAESDQKTAHRLNAEAPGELATAAAKVGAKFIHLSTDYVLDGTSTSPYGEDDAANPLNVYGATKRAGEISVLAAAPDAIILRTSWVFSEYGANFVRTMLRVGKERGAPTIVDDQIGGPTPARNIARTILAIADQLVRGAEGTGLYHYQGAPIACWADFAAEIFSAADYETKIQPIATRDYPTPAERPLRTILNCSKIGQDFGIQQPDWRAELPTVVSKLLQTLKNS